MVWTSAKLVVKYVLQMACFTPVIWIYPVDYSISEHQSCKKCAFGCNKDLFYFFVRWKHRVTHGHSKLYM